ncbi:lipid A-modifier LpxR family protein [Paracoccus sp. p3-h83]|uniref:lipid A-modifier LpxR family protein n=1 Tax=Paracoccus sp. p3-h83 TaxID=3342805 RepID=UPI0035B920B3
MPRPLPARRRHNPIRSLPRRAAGLMGRLAGGLMGGVAATVGIIATCATTPAMAQSLLVQGLGHPVGGVHVFANDALGDRHDRWQSMGYAYSRLYENSFFGNATELRARGQIVAPWSLTRQPVDRDYANAIGLGAFTIGQSGVLGYRVGAELLITGDQTGLRSLQKRLHDIFGGSSDEQIGRNYNRLANGWHGLAKGEVWARLGSDRAWEFRPYAGAQVGYETSATAGFDVILGPAAHATYWVRDEITGTPLVVNNHERHGFSLIAGADVTRLKDSIFFPEQGSIAPEKTTRRARLGVLWRSDPVSVFFGQAWLSRQFEGQVEPQRLGVLSLDFRF